MAGLKAWSIAAVAGLAMAGGLLSSGCGTAAVSSGEDDALQFQLQDIKTDTKKDQVDSAEPDGVSDTGLDAPDVASDAAPDGLDAEDTLDVADTPDEQDNGPADIYVPECVTDTTCDDNDLCTVDLCANDKCLHTPTPGCCHIDSDCPKAPTCKAAQCVNNACVNSPVANCCASGVCCDSQKQTTKVAQAPCTDAPVAFQFDCQGTDIWGRRALQGCDGKQTAACSGNADNYNWTDWAPVASCPGGSLCQKKPDKSQFPSCSGAPAPKPSCIDDIGCYDGDPCTTDTCQAGSCVYAFADPTTLCGTTALFTQYDCLNAPGGGEGGGSIITRSQFSSCGAAGACDGKAVWSPWSIIEDCAANAKCDVPISTEPGTCALLPVCKPGTTCCGADGQYLSAGTACGTTTVATEYQCGSTVKGSQYSVREGVAGCAGTSALCSAQTPAWGNWKAAGTCAPNQLCSVPVAGAPPVCTDVCTPGTTCCTDGGDWADQNTKCADALLKSISKCTTSSGIQSVLSAQLFPGCTGVDDTCSTDPANLAQSAYTVLKTCQAYEKCVQTGDSADCVLNTPCTPGTQCCDASGQFAPVGLQCLPANKVQYSCSTNLPGGSVLTRDVYYGCSGYSTQCSYDPANYFFSPWKDTTDCLATEACTSTDLNWAECTTVYQCVPGTICCDANGKYMTKGTKCGPPDVIKTEYQCDSAGLGGSILKKEYYAGCIGTAATCSKADGDLVWDPAVWLVKKACSPMEYCHVTGPTDPGLCNTTPP